MYFQFPYKNNENKQKYKEIIELKLNLVSFLHLILFTPLK